MLETADRLLAAALRELFSRTFHTDHARIDVLIAVEPTKHSKRQRVEVCLMLDCTPAPTKWQDALADIMRGAGGQEVARG